MDAETKKHALSKVEELQNTLASLMSSLGEC
jgi:hypothetical protein